MAPKADKKRAEKKPDEVKKTAVAEKAPAEKKPKAGKKLPKEGGSVAGDKKKKRVETYKMYIFKVLKQKMSTGELLDIEPLELKFPFELKKQISSSLQLLNKTESYVAFKVETTNPKKYCVRPNTGVVLPRSTCDVIVTMHAQKEDPPDIQCKDKFLLQSVVTCNGVTAKDITPDMFSEEAGHVVEECKLRVVYVSPPQPPSPVAEGSEEGSLPRASHMDNDGNTNSSELTRAFVDTHDKSFELHMFITSAPKADKKPAEKKLAEEKKTAVAEKALTEKKPKAGNKLAKEGDAVAGDKKKRVKKTVKTYKIYIFMVLKQKMSTGELLDIQPLELKFPFELKKQISSSLQLLNKTESYVAFKVESTNPKKYCVRPNTGVVLPRSTCDVIVTMQAQNEAPPDMQCKDKFFLQSVVTSNGVTANDITPEMFSKEAGHVVEECKLRVVYVSPPQPPSPVAEGSEEGSSSPRASHMDNDGNANSSELTRAFVDTHDKSSELYITSAPKVDKKPAEKKPAEEKKTVVAEKALTEKKLKAGKKLSKEGSAVAGDKKKKRVKKSVKTYEIFIFKKMSTGEFLDREPLELKFPFELKKQISSSLQLLNKTESYVAFKKEAPPDMQCKDKFLLQSVVASNGVTAKDITPEMLSKEAGHVVEECKLRVVYVSPPQPPSPVAEGSEEGSEEGSLPRASHMDNNGNANSSELTRAFVDTHDKSSELHMFITSAPKADKKPAEKKPAEEKKTAVPGRSPSEKKPKVGKKQPKEGDAVAGDKKKRVKKRVKTYKIYIFMVLKQKMSTGELLDIEPPELKFPFELKKQISSSLQLSNKSESYVAFKVETMTNPKKYCARPNTDTMQSQKEAPPDMQCKDKFLLQSVVTSNGVTAKDMTPEMFSKEAGHVELRVVYVSPPQPPSPVAEGSEEGSLPRASHMDNNGNANRSEVTRAFVDTHDKSSEVKKILPNTLHKYIVSVQK